MHSWIWRGFRSSKPWIKYVILTHVSYTKIRFVQCKKIKIITYVDETQSNCVRTTTVGPSRETTTIYNVVGRWYISIPVVIALETFPLFRSVPRLTVRSDHPWIILSDGSYSVISAMMLLLGMCGVHHAGGGVLNLAAVSETNRWERRNAPPIERQNFAHRPARDHRTSTFLGHNIIVKTK